MGFVMNRSERIHQGPPKNVVPGGNIYGSHVPPYDGMKRIWRQVSRPRIRCNSDGQFGD